MIYFAKLKGLKTAEAKEWSLKYLKRVGLENKANLNIEKLSGGQQQKIQLGLTIIGEPDLLILDEPTKGFDPVNRETSNWKLLKKKPKRCNCCNGYSPNGRSWKNMSQSYFA